MTEAFVKYPTGGKHIAKIENIKPTYGVGKNAAESPSPPTEHRNPNRQQQQKKKKSELNPRNASRPKLSLSHGRLLVP